MTEIITKVFTFNELSDPAKVTAREWYLEGAFDYDWWDNTYEDADTIGIKITSFDVYRVEIEGRLIDDAVAVAKAIIENHGPDCDTYKLAKIFCTEVVPVRMLKGEDDYRGTEEYNQAAASLQKNLLTAYLTMLGNEYTWLSSDECVDDSIRSNEYTFTETGERFG